MYSLYEHNPAGLEGATVLFFPDHELKDDILKDEQCYFSNEDGNKTKLELQTVSRSRLDNCTSM